MKLKFYCLLWKQNIKKRKKKVNNKVISIITILIGPRSQNKKMFFIDNILFKVNEIYIVILLL